MWTSTEISTHICGLNQHKEHRQHKETPFQGGEAKKYNIFLQKGCISKESPGLLEEACTRYAAHGL